MHPTDEQLKDWKRPSEDSFIERKTSSDPSDWVRTIVALANSTPPGRCGVLYIGVRDDGSVEGLANLDSLQKTLAQKLKAVHPFPAYSTRVLTDDGLDYLCVIVPPSTRRPHFAGPAYVRVGSQTTVASEQQHERLIAEHNSKTRRILQFEGKTIRVERVRSGKAAQLLGRLASAALMEVVGCTAFSVALKDQYGQRYSIALDRVGILDDPDGRSVIVLEIMED
jgi:hypothetical protein